MKITMEELKTRIKLWTWSAEKEPRLLLVRGISGVGKTTFVERVFGNVCPTMSTDDFWVDPETGEYRFVKKRLSEAHASFRMRVLAHLFENCGPLILHNTASRWWEYEDILTVAKQIGYEVEVWTLLPDTSSGQPNLFDVWQNNAHDTPLAKLEEQYQRWEPCSRFDETVIPWHLHRNVGASS